MRRIEKSSGGLAWSASAKSKKMSFEAFVAQHKMVGIWFESYLYFLADTFSEDYHGGFWKSKNLESQENLAFFYLELDDDAMYRIRNVRNDYDKGPMDSKTFSLALFAYALNTFGYTLYEKAMPQSELFFEMYHCVMKHALEILGDEQKHSQFYWFLD